VPFTELVEREDPAQCPDREAASNEGRGVVSLISTPTRNPAVYLGVDIGTSGCRTLAVDSEGRTLAMSEQTYPLYAPQPGWAEQEPEDWVTGAFETIADVCASGAFETSAIAGIGVDGQSWACVPVGDSGRVLARTPIWMDTRCQSIVEELGLTVSTTDILRLSGNPLSPNYATAKLIWFQRNSPDVYARTRWFLQSNSLIVMALTGVATQDHSQGYGFHFVDIATGQVDAAMAARLGIDVTRLPKAVEPTAVVGRVTKAAALLTGVPEGTPVVAGGLDAACGALGAGVREVGQTQEQGGQAGGMSICVSAPVANDRLILSRHVVPDMWLIQGGTVAGSASLAWLGRVVGQAEQDSAARAGMGLFEEISALVERVEAGADGLVFLPYLCGERSPIWDADARGAFVGLTLGTDRGQLYRAVMEGVAMALRHNLEVARVGGAQVRELLAVGGATRSPVWMQIKADVTGLPVVVTADQNASPLGAAMLAAVGAGGRDFEELTSSWVRNASRYLPQRQHQERYDRLYAVYAGLYPALSQSMHDLADFGRRR
jgi:xylulokinase